MLHREEGEHDEAPPSADDLDRLPLPAVLLAGCIAGLLLSSISERERERKPAYAALTNVGLGDVPAYMYDVSEQGNVLAFYLCKYVSHNDHTDLYAGLLNAAASTDGWHTESLPASECPFLPASAVPANTVFEAWFVCHSGTFPDGFPDSLSQGDLIALFDADTGLFIYSESDT